MSLPAAYFDDFYGDQEDPWGFRDRWYEKRKRALTLAALPHERYGRAFEPGCGNGELTAVLAERCDELQSADVSSRAVQAAQERTTELRHVTVTQGSVPGDWPDGSFDLVVLAEMGYYLSSDDLSLLARQCRERLNPGGVLLGCHWRHPVSDYPLAADEVHQVLGAQLGRVGGWRDADFLLDVWSADATSVAAREGLA